MGYTGEETTRYMRGAINLEGAQRMVEAIAARYAVERLRVEPDGRGCYFIAGRWRGRGYFEIHSWREAGGLFPW